MREPCRWCLKDGYPNLGGYIREANGQDVVRCTRCDRQCYNAPKSETGKPQRNIKSRPDITPSQRAKILERDNHQCLLCGRSPRRDPVILHIGHILSVDEGKKLDPPATDEKLYADDNLFACCEECNLGRGGLSLPPRLILQLIQARVRRPVNGWMT